MAQTILAGDTSGTVTLQAPAVAGSTVITLPATTGTAVVTGSTATVSQSMLAANVAGNGPAFSAYQSSAQTISAATTTKVQFQTKVFDTNINFDNSANYRFTPTVAGYYQVVSNIYVGNTAQASQLSVYKNGTIYQSSPYFVSNGVGVSGLVFLNGSTDYIEIYAYLLTGGTLSANSYNTYFQAAMARAA